jgi:hypothetical protein
MPIFPNLKTLFASDPAGVAWLATSKKVYCLAFWFKKAPKFSCSDCNIRQDGDATLITLCNRHIDEALA